MKKATILALCCLQPLPALAQDPAWDFSATVYGWVPGLDATVETPFGDVASGAAKGDVIDNLDMAFFTTFEARRDRWGILVDVVYAKLSTDKDTPFGALFSEADIKMEMSAVSAYGLYRSYESDHLLADVGFGVRAFGLDLDTRLKPGSLAERNFGGDKTWALPLVAGRFIVPINDQWFATAFFDYGKTDDATSTWQGVATVGYRINDRWTVQAGYRQMDLQQEVAGRDADIKLKGPVIGVNYRF